MNEPKTNGVLTNTPEKTLTVIIADDHPIYLEGLRAVLKKVAGLKVCGEAANGADLVELYKQVKPDLVFTDISMPVMNGIEAARKIIDYDGSAKILALSMFDEENYVIDVLDAGALAYLLKNSGKQEIAEAVQSVLEDKPFVSDELLPVLINHVTRQRTRPKPKRPTVEFSDIELEVIRCICQQLSNKEISREINRGTRTVEGYRKDIIEKMGVKNSAGLVVYAIKHGLFTIE